MNSKQTDSKDQLEKEIQKLDNEIDEEVYKLYKITEEEKKITEVNEAIYAFDSAWIWKNNKKIDNKNIKNEYYLTDLIQIASDQGLKIENIQMQNMTEILQPNNKEELDMLESLAI